MEITTIQLNNLFVHNNVTKLWGFVLGNSTEGYKIEDFVKYCIKNSFDEKEIIFHYYEGSVIYYFLEEPNSIILQKIQNDVTNFFIRIMKVKESGFDDILENYKDWYKKNIGIAPQVKDFFLYLVNSDNSVFNEENLKKYLAEHVFYEESKIIENYQQAKEKQQALIDITPHQTLSIETAAATVEDGKIILTKTGEQFTLTQIALIYYYDKLLLNGNNCNDIILTYGWNSGKKLLEWHTKFSTGTSHRLYAPSSGKRIYSVLEYLTTEKGKTDAKKDLKDINFDFE